MFDWLRASKDKPVPSTEGGHSGYLSAPEATLDPNLFDGELLKGAARHAIINPLVRYLTGDLDLDKVTSWLRIWLAGSGITYQWAGNDDLDVMLGINRAKFDKANPAWAADGDDDLGAWLNGKLKSELWPTTADLPLGQHSYEVTYFYSGTDDIRRIHPYAAIDVMTGKWVVRPPQLPPDPAALYPQDWFEKAEADHQYTQYLAGRYRKHLSALQAAQPGSPGHINAGAALNLVTAQAGAMFDDIHHGRRIAFQGGGEGYMDQHNFRWQMAKGSGTIKALKEITGVRSQAEEQNQQELYGAKLEPAAELLRRAVAQQRKPNELRATELILDMNCGHTELTLGCECGDSVAAWWAERQAPHRGKPRQDGGGVLQCRLRSR